MLLKQCSRKGQIAERHWSEKRHENVHNADKNSLKEVLVDLATTLSVFHFVTENYPIMPPVLVEAFITSRYGCLIQLGIF